MRPVLSHAVRMANCATLAVAFLAVVLCGGIATAATLDITVATGNDDGFEDSGGDVKLGDDKLELGKHPYAATRFQNVTIPQGATITSAYVRFKAASEQVNTMSISIYGEDVDNASAFSSNYYNISNRAKTTASVSWSTGGWKDNDTRDTPDLKSVIQEIVDRGGWNSGSSIVILFKSNNTTRQQFAWARDNGSSDAPRLHVEYTVPSRDPKNFYVRPDGNDSNSGDGPGAGQAWRTMTHAATSSELIPGDTVYVMTGTYTGAIAPSVAGSSGSPIRFVADREGTVFGSAGNVTLAASSGNEAIDLDNASYLELVGFRIDGSNGGSGQQAVELDSSTGIVFESCEIFGAPENGVDATNSSVTLINCLIHGNGGEGARNWSGSTTIWNCTLAYNDSDGIEQDAGVVTVTNSIIAFNNSSGLDRNGGTMINSYNLIYGNASLAYNGASAGAGDIFQDPLFVDAAGGDYRLQAGSPAINAGTNASGTVDDDQDGNARPIGAAWDMGCYEYPLLGWWKFDEGSGSTAADSSGNGNDGVLYGGAGWEAARCGYAAALDGANDWVDLGGLDLGTKAYAFTAWFKTTAQSQQTILAATESGASNHHVLVELDSDGHVQFTHRSPPATSGGTTIASTSTYRDGAWHHLAAVKSQSQLLLYVDGLLVAQASDTTSTHSSVDLVLGRAGASLSQNYYQGSLDDVRVYGTALSAAEIAAMYGLLLHWKLDESSGAIANDSSGTSRHGAVSGSPAWQPDGGQIDGALELDGSGDQIEDANAENYLTGLTELTISLWVKSDATDIDKGILFTNTPSGSDDRIGLRYDKDGWGGGGAEVIKASISTTGGSTQIESSSFKQTTAWQHLAITWTSGQSLKLYIDGVLDAPSFDTGPVSGSINNVTRLLVGIGAKSAYWDGRLDDLRIYNRALCPDEIESLRASGLPKGVRIVKWVEVK